MMNLYKYQGAGNDFLIADNLNGDYRVEGDFLLSKDGEKYSISGLCDRRYGIGADGLMLLCRSDGYDFRMEYYNSDGSGGMMCGNGGRCIVAFADMLMGAGCKKVYEFEAADGYHCAEVLYTDGKKKIVRLKMMDVRGMTEYDSLQLPDGKAGFDTNGVFLNTGTRHFVHFVHSRDEFSDVVVRGRMMRYAREFAPEGANVNFVCPGEGGIEVRTYEKGVEDETFACGTGIVASVLATYRYNPASCIIGECTGSFSCRVQAKKDELSVDFRPCGEGFDSVYLTGPACFVAELSL